MENVEQVLRNTGVIPVIQLEDEMKAVPLGQALLDGGIPAAEVTFRTPAAAKSIEKIAAALPEMFVCAGTVLSVEQAKLAVDCGAKAVISPGTNREVVEWCLKNQVPCTPPAPPHRGGGRPGPGPHHGEALPRGSGGGREDAQGSVRPLPGCEVHAYRRHQPQQCEGLPLPAQRHRLRRQLALPRRGHQRGQLGGHHPAAQECMALVQEVRAGQ